MPFDVIFPEWLNANSMRSYPLREDASLTSIDGEVVIPRELVVDAKFNVPAGYAGSIFFISAIELVSDRVTLSVSVWNGSSQSLVTTIVAPVESHVRNNPYPFIGVGANSTIMGSITIGKVEEVLSRVQGGYSFAYSEAPFEGSTVYISQPMVEQIILQDKGQDIATLGRTIRLKAGQNIRLTRVSPETIRIDAIPGENLDDCPDPVLQPPPIRMINGVPPDIQGNFRLIGSECISIQTRGSNSLEFRDLCSTSCCGCDELATLIDALHRYESQQSDLRDQIYRSYSDSASIIASLTTFLSS